MGFSTLTSSGQTAISKQQSEGEKPNIVTVLGNHLPFNAERILENITLLTLLSEEKEKTIIELVNSLKLQETFKFEELALENNTIISAPDQQLIEDLDSLPFPNQN